MSDVIQRAQEAGRVIDLWVARHGWHDVTIQRAEHCNALSITLGNAHLYFSVDPVELPAGQTLADVVDAHMTQLVANHRKHANG